MLEEVVYPRGRGDRAVAELGIAMSGLSVASRESLAQPTTMSDGIILDNVPTYVP